MNEDAVRLWIRKAENDLKIGRDELATAEPATDAICFHMQQCAEKYLKSFLIFHGREHPRSHDIAFIISLCSRLDPTFGELLNEGVQSLTRYAVAVRYDEEMFPTVDEARRALALAEQTKAFVLGKLKEAGFDPGQFS